MPSPDRRSGRVVVRDVDLVVALDEIVEFAPVSSHGRRADGGERFVDREARVPQFVVTRGRRSRG